MLKQSYHRHALFAFTAVGLAVCEFPTPCSAQDSQSAAIAKVQREKVAAAEVANTQPTARDEEGKGSGEPAAADAERQKRRAGERVGEDPRGRSQVLGMFVQESKTGGVKVVEVAAASPAFEAGIREGDELVEFNSFKGSNYRKWIDGMRKVATAAVDNSMLPVIVVRNGAQFATEIRVPASHTGAFVKLPTGPLPQGPPQEAPQQGSSIAIAGGGPGISIDNSGQFDNFFNNDPGVTSDRAIAELFRAGGAEKPPVADTVNAASPRADKSARIGLAGFRNDANGMNVMVDVGGLQPGNYAVAVADPSVAGLQQQQSELPNAQQQEPGAAPPVGADPQQQTPAAPGAIGTPQGSASPEFVEVPRGILAQLGESRQPAASAPPVAPPTGKNQPLDVPPTGNAAPSDTTPTGQSIVNQNLDDRARRANVAGNNAGTTPGNQIGTLTVDQSGTGRLQQAVEGMQVRDIVGRALVIYSQTADPQNTLPPNLDPTADPSGGQPNAAETQNAGANPGSQIPPAGNVPPASAIQPTGQPKGLVAAGIIRLVADHGAAPSGETPGAGAGTPIQQPADNFPPAGANPIRQ